MKKNTQILSEKLAFNYEGLKNILERGIALTSKIGSGAEIINALQERKEKLDRAAMFVIVGEVKAGKSSFINALIGDEICDVDPAPCTSSIQELVYGKERRKIQLNNKRERIFLPVDELNTITIVDTPGTNSIIKEHQLITEEYLPQCDIAVFVFPAKNPHTQTAWELLALIQRDWMHRVVFVLQQADLATKAELDTNLERVRSYARERNVSEPKIFPVSALRERQGAQDSGFAEFRAYLRSSVESGDVWQIKFDGACTVLKQVITSIRSGLHEKKSLILDDIRFLEDLEKTLTERKSKLDKLQHLVVKDLLGTYDQVTGMFRQKFESGLEVGTILRRSLPIVRDKTIKDWIHNLNEEFKTDSAKDIEEAAAFRLEDIKEEINSMIDTIESKVKLQSDKSLLRQQNVVDDREKIFRSLLDALDKDRLGKHLQNVIEKDTKLELNILGGGGLAIIGAAVAVFTKVAIFEVTGGILSAVGALVITLTLVWKRGAVLKEFNQKLFQGKEYFEQQISSKISILVERLFNEIVHMISVNREKLEKAKDDSELEFREANAILKEVCCLRGE